MAKCYNPSACSERIIMTKLTVENALQSNQNVQPNLRYWMYRKNPTFMRIAPPTLMGDYDTSWQLFIHEMRVSEKCSAIREKLIEISNLCISLAVSPSVFFYMTNEEIKEWLEKIYGAKEWKKVEENFSEDFFNTLSAGIMARIQDWETGE